MTKTANIIVQNHSVRVISENGQDYLCLTDMISAKEGSFFVSDWLRNRNTLEFLAVWEQLHNPDFNYGEFAIIASSSGLNSYKISVKEWIEKTNAKGIISKTGRYGGTYAQKDIAFEFGTWISPGFKLYLIKEFQRLKEEESSRMNIEWDFRRFLSKVNYRVHTDAIKDFIIPSLDISPDKEGIIYADEAELLNLALFGKTSKQWRKENPNAPRNHNIRDYGDMHQLTVLANIQGLNASYVRQGLSADQRLNLLRSEVVSQLKSLYASPYTIHKIQSPFKKESQMSTFNQDLTKALNFKPKKKE